MAEPPPDLNVDVPGCAAAHQRLLAFLDAALAARSLDTTKPSRLPGWSVGHVITHLARNADALRQMSEAAEAGEKLLMYPTADYRGADIETGSRRPAEVLVEDLRRAATSLEWTWQRMSEAGWTGYGLARFGRVSAQEFPWRRWREVEVHHADLGLAGFGPEQWSMAYIASDLPRYLANWQADGNELPGVVAAAVPWRQLAWLFGRDPGPDLPPAPTL